MPEGKGTRSRVVKYSTRTYSFRLPKEAEKQFLRFCEDAGINKSDLIQQAVLCFLSNSDCIARKGVHIKPKI